MKKISKTDQARIDEALKECEAAATKLNGAVDAFNEVVEQHRGVVEEAVGEYNEKVDNLRAIYEDIHSEADSYMGERSDRWQESDAGQSYQEWIDQLSDPSIEPIEIDLPDPLDYPDIPDFTDDSWLPPSEPGGF